MAESKPSDWSDLHWAVWTQNLDSVKQILSTAPATAHAKDDLGWTPLHLACCSNTSRLWQTAQLEPRGLNGSAGIGSILTSRPGASERYRVLAYTYSRSTGPSDDVGLGSGNVAEPSVSFFIALELLHAGAVANTQGHHPPLHCAASSGWPDHLDALVYFGSDVHCDHMCSPVCYAAQGHSFGHRMAFEYLKKSLGPWCWKLVMKGPHRQCGGSLPPFSWPTAEFGTWFYDRHLPNVSMPALPGAAGVVKLETPSPGALAAGECTLCRSISIEALRLPSGYLHARSWKDLEASAKSCKLCAFFMSLFGFCRFWRSGKATTQVILRGSTSLSCPTKLATLRVQLSPGCYCNRAWHDTPSADPGSFSSCLGRCRPMLLRDVELDLFTNDEQASERQNPGGIQLGRLPDAEGRPEDLKGLLKGWLQQCKDSHKCGDSSLRGEGEHRELPGRLIDTSEFWPGTCSRISLALGRDVGTSATYAALSHRWPEGQPTDHEWTTKTSNIDDRRRGFDAGTLPVTVRDAITMARQLGIRYLWVDSVCILQDSAEDWRVESSKMLSVYGDAEVTLFADCVENDDDTFLKPRDRGRFQSRRGSPLGVLDASHRHIKSTIAERYSRYRPEKPAKAIDIFLSDTIQSHLSTRAWIYQEQVVSRRRIHFGRHQAYWSCGELCEAEDGTDLRPSLPGWYKWLSSPRRGLTAGPNPNERVSDAKEELWLQHRNWAMLLENYTARSLTRSSDKQVAVAAVAERFGKIFDDVYKVGCWERCFRLNLLWAARPTREPGYRMGPRDMQLPSWSWLSADETIEYPHLHVSRTTRTQQTGLMHVYFLVLKTPEIINGASGPFSSIPIFCETIEVEGLLEPATCSRWGGLGLHGQAPHWHHRTRQHPGHPEQSPYVLLYGGADMERIIGSMIPDRRGGVPLGEVMLLKTTEVEGSTPCSCCQLYKTNYVHFLVLEQDVDDENRFYRVGFGWTYVRHDQSIGLRDAEMHDGSGLWKGEPRVFELA